MKRYIRSHTDYRFSKEKMIARVKREGREDLLDETTLAFMDNLDGQPCETSCWRRQVYQEPVYWCIGKDGEGAYVNENDCI